MSRLNQDVSRRTFLQGAAALAAGHVLAGHSSHARSEDSTTPIVRTVLGPVEPERLGATLMHEHAPVVDWSELYETPAADWAPVRQQMVAENAAQLDAFHRSLAPKEGPGAIVECTPIRVGRYPDLMVELARRTKVHVIACTGFWGEGLAPMHPWALRMGLEKDGVRRIADLYVREIREGMEDPSGEWGERFTSVRAGIIKAATSTSLRPTERRCHEAAAIASIETGCPITTHTTDGGGLEEAQLFLAHGVKPAKVIIGHQGNKDDRSSDEPLDYHLRLAELGCYVQFDRVGHPNYEVEKMARLIKGLIAAGYAHQLLVGHDHVPFLYRHFARQDKPGDGWQGLDPDFTVVTTQLVPELARQGVSAEDVRTILVENPRRVLAF